jgi:hypothetical protein
MISDAELQELERLLREDEISEAKKHFWNFCKLREPSFYRDDRPHLKKLCDTLEDFYYGKLLMKNGLPYLKLMIRIPPQHGKSRTLVNFTMWCLGRNNEERIITASRSDSQAADFARFTRDGISEVKNLETQTVFSDIFPDTKIKRGDASVQKWALEGQHFNYLGVGVSGGVTGKGATLRIMDDLIKDAEQALSDNAMNKIWVWLSGTFSSRNSAEGGEVKEIFCATLWGENDPQSMLETTEPGEWYILSMPIYDAEKDEMLCKSMMGKRQFEKLRKRMEVDSRTKMIFQANYMCVAISDDESKVFPVSSLNRYKEFPSDMEYFTIASIDTADKGDNYFSMPIARVYGNRVYVFDAIHDNTGDLKQYLPETLGKIRDCKINEINIETNSFGAWFKDHLLDAQIPGLYVYGAPARANKMGRILATAGLVKYFFYFPEKPTPVLQIFIDQMCKLMKTSTKDDDAPDAICALAVYLEKFYQLFKEE